ncbi:MAG: Zn-dependent hydrolase [Bacteroidetes bacterium]|nr:MAG: Zn-dependent hydrolase [Bacteroidota bacterium]
MNKFLLIGLAALLMAGLSSCNAPSSKEKKTKPSARLVKGYQMKKYAKVKLTSDISHLSENQHKMLRLLFQAADIMDGIFWKENVEPKAAFLTPFKDPEIKEYATINYGPWDEMNNLTPFVEGWGAKSKGAEFYPHNMTVKEFENFKNPDKTSLYTLIKRDNNGKLQTVWYHEAFKKEVERAAGLLLEASKLAENKGFAHYLELRSKALLTDDYFESDMAWLDMNGNLIDIVIGPIENYTDQLFGYKAAHESFVLLKDVEWSNKLSKYAKFLPQLQKELPVDPKYKQETPGLKADLNAYDVVYYAGDCNMAGKTIAINLPNDERVQLKKGTRKLQLKNAMRAKFDEILVPISKVLIAPNQRQYITFNAFFSNTMFHEVAHGMGIKNTINGKGPVRKALKEKYSAIEEGKADILGLYLVNRLYDMGEFTDTKLMDNYVTFMAGIFRSVRFGASSAHGMANMLRFNFFLKKGAFTRNEDGTYLVNFDKMKIASKELTQKILKIQGDGDYAAAKKWIETDGIIPQQLKEDLDKVNSMGIPVDIYFEQGPQVLGLK